MSTSRGLSGGFLFLIASMILVGGLLAYLASDRSPGTSSPPRPATRRTRRVNLPRVQPISAWEAADLERRDRQEKDRQEERERLENARIAAQVRAANYSRGYRGLPCVNSDAQRLHSDLQELNRTLKKR